MRIKGERKIKFVALLFAISLIGLTSAALLSMRLPWNLEVTDADYKIEWTVSEPSTVAALSELDTGGLTFTAPDTTGHAFVVVFQVENAPVGSNATEDIQLQFNGGSWESPDATGKIEYAYAISIGQLTRTLDMSIIMSYLGDWEFSFTMVTPP